MCSMSIVKCSHDRSHSGCQYLLGQVPCGTSFTMAAVCYSEAVTRIFHIEQKHRVFMAAIPSEKV